MIRIFLILLTTCMTASVQGDSTFVELYQRFRSAASFDHNFPREKVYLHLDNNAYFEGETIWFKAYVVRSSTLQPTTLSRVAYAELLNADGQLIERKLLKVDSLGQADGFFELKLPIKSGYYEVRAFTREMLNWDSEGCFSRVIPIFEAPNEANGTVPQGLEISRPQSWDNPKETSSLRHVEHPRRQAQLTFYPESGQRIRGAAQRIAYKLTSKKGFPLSDTIQVFSADGALLLTSVPVHEGMGCFDLPKDFPETGYAVADGRQFPLPAFSEENYTLRTDTHGEDLIVSITSTTSDNSLMGIAAFCRDRVCYFDTLTLQQGITEYIIPYERLYGGINRIELFDPKGRSRASRNVWKNGGNRRLTLSIRQNDTTYSAFSPIAMELHLSAPGGEPVATTISVAVRDEASDIISSTHTGALTDLLLTSELKGYIHRPEYYFEKDDPIRHKALDLLLMIQGWKANRFEVLSGDSEFQLIHPIEDRLTLTGHVYRENNKRQPYPHLQLDLSMYSISGGSLTGNAVTDSLGRFVFQSNVDYEGDYIAQFTTRNEKGKKTWSRIAIDRWFSPTLRPYHAYEKDWTLYSHPLQTEEESTKPEIFEWTDTLPQYIQTQLGEAVIIHKNKYRGFTGNRYTRNGGEEGGMRHSDWFYNTGMETERIKDMGMHPGYIHEFLCQLDSRNAYHPTGEPQTGPEHTLDIELSPILGEERTTMSETEKNAYAAGTFDNEFEVKTDDSGAEMYFRNAPAAIYLNNSSVFFPFFTEPMLAEEIKSVAVMRNGAGARHLVGRVNPKYKYVIVLYEWPDYYRYKSKKGTERRRIQGYSKTKEFYHPNYRGLDLPTIEDCRRTLYWNPSVKTDIEGNASIVFFNNSREGTKISVSAAGVSNNGLILE